MHHRAKDITGLTAGYLTAMRYIGSDGRRSLWEVKCRCGKLLTMAASDLGKLVKNDNRSSCGCMRKATISERNTKHGMSAHPAYWVWRSMNDRCRLPSHHAWANYGGRGIKVCATWQTSFDVFWADMGPTYSTGLTLERVKNNCGYSPTNCVWATCKVQNANRRDNRKLNTPKGRMILAEAARQFGVKYTTLLWRLDNGWTTRRALGVSTT